jgi:hypothetical protein
MGLVLYFMPFSILFISGMPHELDQLDHRCICNNLILRGGKAAIPRSKLEIIVKFIRQVWRFCRDL